MISRTFSQFSDFFSDFFDTKKDRERFAFSVSLFCQMLPSQPFAQHCFIKRT